MPSFELPFQISSQVELVDPRHAVVGHPTFTKYYGQGTLCIEVADIVSASSPGAPVSTERECPLLGYYRQVAKGPKAAVHVAVIKQFPRLKAAR